MKTRVLIVDDEPLARERVRALLHGLPDIECIGECADGISAVSAIRKDAPDIVLLDVQMPELDGFGVISQLSDGKMPAVIFVTAYDRFALKAFEVHAVDYLLKPFDKERFTTALNRAIDQVKRQQAGRRVEPAADGAPRGRATGTEAKATRPYRREIERPHRLRESR